MHWQALLLPVLSWGKKTANGFRTNELGYSRRDHIEVLTNTATVEWIQSENWHQDEISTRGRVAENLAGRRILLIGAGALGSVVGELLVRSGCREITVTDADRLTAGNLVRHTLSLNEVGMSKAKGMAHRLEQASPHASVICLSDGFPPTSTESLSVVNRAEIVIDCTASDDVLRQLEDFPWPSEKVFVSISLGFRSQRVFFFVANATSFPHAAYNDAIRPWLEREKSEYTSDDFPREGVGCWHPVFPARIDDVWMMGSAAVKLLEEAVTRGETESLLEVLEQEHENCKFMGLHRAQLEPDSD
jgi:hypothetical protein